MTRNKSVFTLVNCALLVALEIVLSRFFSIPLPLVKIGFGFLPLAMAGMLFGPWAGFAVGAVSDFLGANLFPIGPYWVGFTLVAGLSGMCYGLFLREKKESKFGHRAWNMRVLAAVLVVCVVMQLGLDTLNVAVFMGRGVLGILPVRALKAVVMIPVQFLTIQGVRRVTAGVALKFAR